MPEVAVVKEELQRFPMLYVLALLITFGLLTYFNVDFFTVGLVGSFAVILAIMVQYLYTRGMLPREWLVPLGMLGIMLTVFFYGLIVKGVIPLIAITGIATADAWMSSVIYAGVFTAGMTVGAALIYMMYKRGVIKK
ncbi:MAG: hypothetical protein DRJ67_03725 [Thermoprotei archaeon]|nr:MAG: hypothetical protein DRJ67_03725 [Thermoprotei archaeon]